MHIYIILCYYITLYYVIISNYSYAFVTWNNTSTFKAYIAKWYTQQLKLVQNFNVQQWMQDLDKTYDKDSQES